MKPFIVTLFFSMALMVNLDECKSRGNPISGNDTSSVIINDGDFEADSITNTPEAWKTAVSQGNASASHTASGGHTGKYCLEQSSSSAYKIYTYQTLVNLPDGYYSFRAYVRNGGGQNSCYLLAKGFGSGDKMTSLPVSNNWGLVVIRGIHVTDGMCTVGLYSDANAGNWCQMDDVQFVKDGIPYTFLKGGDISELDYLESKGAVFYENGVTKDCLQILRDQGFNIVRLRLYNDPGNPNYSPSKLLPAGFQNPTDILKLARRAKAMGFEIELTFYYSDYWSNGIPHDWDSLSVSGLDSAVYAFTFSFMNQMNDQGGYVTMEIKGDVKFGDGRVRTWMFLWALRDLNPRPADYESAALTN